MISMILIFNIFLSTLLLSSSTNVNKNPIDNFSPSKFSNALLVVAILIYLQNAMKCLRTAINSVSIFIIFSIFIIKAENVCKYYFFMCVAQRSMQFCLFLNTFTTNIHTHFDITRYIFARVIKREREKNIFFLFAR